MQKYILKSKVDLPQQTFKYATNLDREIELSLTLTSSIAIVFLFQRNGIISRADVNDKLTYPL